jgi:hypothetical protein
LIVSAPRGDQATTLHRQAFYIGGWVERGAIAYVTAYDALVAAARAMPTHDPKRPWRGLEDRIARQLAVGMARPLPILETDIFMRSLHARRFHGAAS